LSCSFCGHDFTVKQILGYFRIGTNMKNFLPAGATDRSNPELNVERIGKVCRQSLVFQCRAAQVGSLNIKAINLSTIPISRTNAALQNLPIAAWKSSC
jgi:hypothetical protein